MLAARWNERGRIHEFGEGRIARVPRIGHCLLIRGAGVDRDARERASGRAAKRGATVRVATHHSYLESSFLALSSLTFSYAILATATATVRVVKSAQPEWARNTTATMITPTKLLI